MSLLRSDEFGRSNNDAEEKLALFDIADYATVKLAARFDDQGL
jgi:hypothetical protein